MRFLRLGKAGMRGEIATGITPELAIDFASALGTYLERGTVLVGYDTRISSNVFKNATISALLSTGCNVVNAGIVSAPQLHFMVPHLKVDGGLLIGAGHHPKGWNALVPISANGAYFNSVRLQELLDIYHSKRFNNEPWNKIGSESNTISNIQEKYLDKVCANLNVDAIASANLMVVADFCNGSGSPLATRFAERLGLKFLAINKELSGVLPHDPEPRPRTALQTHSVLKPLNADIGFVFNTDMSRTSIVTNTGETLSEEYTMPLVVDQVLAKANKKMKVITNWCTTRSLDEVVKRYDATLHKTLVGESPIIDKMIEINGDIAGDGSGSVAFGNHTFGYDSFMAIGTILEAMAIQKCTSAELANRIPRYHIVKKTISCSSSHAYTLLKRFKNIFADAEVQEVDGFRFNWKDGWVHLRASMTEPIIRMIVEFKSQEKAKDIALHIRGLLERGGI